MTVKKISVILPVYNEESVVFDILESIKKVMSKSGFEHEIIAINDGSTDRSGKILNEIKGINVIEHPYNIGYGASIKRGIIESKGDYILIIDSDGTYSPGDIPLILEHINRYDMVVGARTGKHVKIPVMRKPAKWFLKWLASLLANRKIPDLNSGLRIFKKDLAKEFMGLYPSGFSFTTTITLAFFSHDYTVKYVPINYLKRKGKSSIHPIKDFIGFTNLIIKIITFFNPIKMFTMISIFLGLAAAALLLYSWFVLGKIFDTTIVVVLLAALQIFLFGLIAEMMRRQGGRA